MYLILTIWSVGFVVHIITAILCTHVLSRQIKQAISAGQHIYCMHKVFSRADHIKRFLLQDTLSFLIFSGIAWPLTSLMMHILLCDSKQHVTRQMQKV